jgi:hypothetical protein
MTPSLSPGLNHRARRSGGYGRHFAPMDLSSNDVWTLPLPRSITDAPLPSDTRAAMEAVTAAENEGWPPPRRRRSDRVYLMCTGDAQSSDARRDFAERSTRPS